MWQAPTMTAPPDVHRLAAFTMTPRGGNPAGVVVTEEPLDDATMQQTASDIGYSETAFLVPTAGDRFHVRYFAPTSEVPFCGHATVAAGIVLGETRGVGTYHLDTRSGPVAVEVRHSVDGRYRASLTSVEPELPDTPADLIDHALGLLRLSHNDLDPAFPPAVAFAGAHHLLLVLRTHERLRDLDYDFEELRRLMASHDLTTVALLWRENTTRWHARNAFPIGGVHEDPATGAAAAALGGYLRAGGHVTTPTRFEVLQGEDMGRPSHIQVEVPNAGGIIVTGTAVRLAAP